MFSAFIESWIWIKAHNPLRAITGTQKMRLNFITIHYLYIIALSILGSIIIYPGGNISYIDALFFSSGCATQSGLNTVDINSLKLYQQVVFYFQTMMATPIFINTFVVFVRLYWFERRFQHVAREARAMRRTRSRSRTKTEMKQTPEVEFKERGVNGRNIVVLHSGDPWKSEKAPREGIKALDPVKEIENETPTASSSSSGEGLKNPVDSRFEQQEHNKSQLDRDIAFTGKAKDNPLESPILRLPLQLSPEQHIEFLENQRNPKDKGMLRIPGPRDFDRGETPKTLNMGQDGELLSEQISTPTDRKDQEIPIKRTVTIEDPKSPRARADTDTLSRNISNNTEANSAKSPDEARFRSRSNTFKSLRRSNTTQEKSPMPYLSWQPTIGRNSAFVDLTEEQREELGGIEYRSLKTLAVTLVAYYALFHLLGVLILLPWIVETDTWGSIVSSAGTNKVWWGIFTSASMFNDLGFTLTPDSMISFQEAVVPLLIGSFLIIIGNTGFPCMLRFVIWVSSLCVPADSGLWEEFKFLLDHPRRCFTLLFPSRSTWWLFWILVLLNCIDIILFIILDLHDPVITNINPPGYRVLNGIFQAASTRTAGFATTNLAELHPGIQVSYMVMMYISVFPIAISIRRTNVYEEQSLGIYGSASNENEDENEPSYVGAHLRRQLSFDLWYIFLGLFFIAIAEGKHLQNTNEYAYTIYSVLFEIVSAYGTVGLSLGYPGFNSSFSAQFSVVSKLVIIAMQIRGRHRGLPYELDRAILLPSEKLHEKENVDATKRMLQRRGSGLSQMDTVMSPQSHTGSATGRDPEQSSTVELRKSQTHTSHTSHGSHKRTGLGTIMAGLVAGPHLPHDDRHGSMV